MTSSYALPSTLFLDIYDLKLTNLVNDGPQFIWIGLIASQIAFLVVVSTHGPRTRASIAAGGIGIACTLILTCCSYLQHGHGTRSSSVLVLYLLWTLPMDALRARTLWGTVDGRGAAITIITYASFKLCAFILEIIWKCEFALQSGLCDAPEEKHGIIERALMLRVIPLFARGYRIPLQAQDLYKIAPRLMNGWSIILSMFNFIRASSNLTYGAGNEKEATTAGLVIDIFTSNFSEVLLDPIFPRLGYLALQFTQPFLVERAIDLISDTRGRNFYLNGGRLFLHSTYSELA